MTPWPAEPLRPWLPCAQRFPSRTEKAGPTRPGRAVTSQSRWLAAPGSGELLARPGLVPALGQVSWRWPAQSWSHIHPWGWGGFILPCSHRPLLHVPLLQPLLRPSPLCPQLSPPGLQSATKITNTRLRPGCGRWAIPRGVTAVATKSFLCPPSLHEPRSQQGRWTGQGATRAARGGGRRVVQAARERGQAAGKARARRRSPQRPRRQEWRRLPSAAGVPASGRRRRAPARGRRAPRGSSAPGRPGSPHGSCRRALRVERRVRRGVRHGVRGEEQGGGRAGSLTGRCPRAGGRRQLLQEAHGHFQDVRLLQLRVAGTLLPAPEKWTIKADCPHVA